MRLAMVGTGYVGLVTGTCFSEMGHEVVCVDVDEGKIAALQRGEIPIYEPGLEELVMSNVEDGRLTFTTDIKQAIEDALVVFVAVGTPPQPDGTADLKYVLAVAASVGEHMNGYKIVVDKSTVPVGTADKVRDTIAAEQAKRGVSHEYDVVSNPEFLREGAAIDDFMNPDRVVIGCDDSRTDVLMRELYASFVRDGRPILTMSTRSAEMTKYAANSMLATKISFINEMANICDRAGADIGDVRAGIGADARIGYSFISPGIGYGGSCFPKDVKALLTTAKEFDYHSRILESVDAVNDDQKLVMMEKIQLYFRGDLKGKTFAVWGLAFKPDTDDVREAPALKLIAALLDAGATVRAYDPKAAEATQRELGNPEGIAYIDDHYDTLDGADGLLLATEWPQFRNPDFTRMKNVLRTPVIFDGRNVYNPQFMAAHGLDYISIGRDPVLGHSGK
jgi:UDPglucose 6-dehydrogenase